MNIYLETSIRWNHPGDGIVGIVLATEDLAKTIYGFVKNTTEAQSIIIGLSRALDYCKGYDDIELHLSCSYVAHALENGWLDKWESNYYLRANKKVIKHAKEWHELYKKTRGKNLKIHLNEFNGYRNYLNYECVRRMAKHGRVFQSVESSEK